MKHIAKSAAALHKNSTTCIAYEYEAGTPDINIARIEISGRYPEHGTARNAKVHELVYVVDGAGFVDCNGTRTELSEGDVISITSGESVFWEGTLSLIIACSPAWYPKQYENT